MKRLIFLLMAFVAFAATAQTVTLPSLPLENTLFNTTTDYVITNSTARNFILSAAKQVPATQDFYIQIDSTSGNNTSVTVSLWGSKFGTTYTQIGSTVTWTTVPVPSADTTIVMSNATANRYSYYKWIVTGAGTGTCTIDTQKLKLYLE